MKALVIYISKFVYGVKTYGMSEKEALTGDWGELNKETYVCKVMFTKQLPSLLLRTQM